MTRILTIILASFSFLAFPVMDCGLTGALTDTTQNVVVHTREVYKTVDTFKLKIDIFYSNMTSGRENNTAIVFFHGGGWASGTLDTQLQDAGKPGPVSVAVDFSQRIVDQLFYGALAQW